MYLSRLVIKNFRNLENIDVMLGEKMVLLGENGAGKSNLIEALRILLDSSYRAVLGENDFTRTGEEPFRGRTIEIHGYFSGINPEKDKDLLAVIHDCHGKEENVYQISAVYRPRKDKKPEEATTEDDYELIRFGGGNENNTEGAKRLRQYVRLVVIPAVRDMERDMQSWRTSPLRRLVEMLNLTTQPDFQKIAGNVESASKQLQQIAPIQELQKDIRDIFGNLVEGQSIDPTIGINGANPEDLLRLLTIFAEPNFPVEYSSLGISNILYLITWLVYAERLRTLQPKNGQSPEYILLAIEEPEAHLHPHFQRLVFENVFKRQNLLLVSTHSPTIVSVADPRHFVMLKKGTSGIEVVSTACFPSSSADEAEKEKLLRDMSRFLDATRGEVLFSRGVLLIEGDAEMFLLPAFAKKMKETGKITHTLDGAGISICNVYGTDFRPYVEFLGPTGLNIPLAILTDGDPTSEDNVNGENQGKFAGLTRGKRLAEQFNPDNLSTINEHHSRENWDELRAELEKVGVFVNTHTLEVELIGAGYLQEFCAVYGELGASEKQINNFRQLIKDKDYQKMIKRIEDIGGKGRFAQRLADKLDAHRVPPYIEKAIRCLLEKMPQIKQDALPLPEVPFNAENPEDDIPF